ncbi:MAG: hypothetical protein ACM3O3_12325 [Syntrophothermus sp.]
MSKANGYNVVKVNNHKKSWENGFVYEHIIVAEKILNRYLYDNEIVHHIDENKLNNNKNNIIVFTNKKEHTRFHKLKLNIHNLILLKNGSYKVDDKYIIDNKCIDCESTISKNAIRCLKCSHEKQRKSIRPSSEELYELLLKNNFSKVGRMFNVTYTSIKKWCKQYNIPHNSNYYKNSLR